MSDNPLHIAIIPDGNRRWAKQESLNPWKGHEKSAQNFQDIIEWCYQDPRIGILTIWCFSTENWKRDEKEVQETYEATREVPTEKIEKPSKSNAFDYSTQEGKTDLPRA